jgi:hypothetical protein
VSAAIVFVAGPRMYAAQAPQRAVPAATAVASPDTSAGAESTAQATLQRYCLGCHNQNLKNRGTVPIAFDTLALPAIGGAASSGQSEGQQAQDKEVWEKIVRKVRTGLMPPAGRPRPDKAAHDAFVAAIESALDRAAAAHPNPGRTQPFHRLNRAEYKNVVRDLLDLQVNVDSLLPSDDSSYGFDNIAGVLKMSPTLMERYLGAAQKISRLALGLEPPAPNVEMVRLGDDLQQDEHIEGLPIGTRGGVSIPYNFPMDAEYVIKVRLARDILENIGVFAEDQHLEVSLDGERLQIFTVPGVKPQATAPKPADAAPPLAAVSEQGRAEGQAAGAAAPSRPAAAAPAQGRGARPRPGITQVDTGPRLSPKDRAQRNRIDETWDVRVRVNAGARRVNVAFLKLTAAIDETPRLPFIRPYAANVNTPDNRMGLAVRSVEIVGPFNPTGPGSSPSRRRIFVCQPAASQEAGCAKTILATLARRAYRRPVNEADIAPLIALYNEGRTGGTFDTGIERGLDRLLVSPEFLFRIERDPANAVAGTPYRISDLELASRLSFFLWSSMPDDELLDVAAKNNLHDAAVLRQQVVRMIADARADAFVKNFAGQWLYLRNLPSAMPISFNFPDFDESLRASMQRETELFFDSIIREDRGALDLLSAHDTFLNERLARHYGIPGVKGTHFRRVVLPPDSVRGGLLGQGSVLTVTSHPDRTSPVVRGKWILENFLGTSPPPPPPNVPELKATGEAGAVLSMRERMAQHRANPVCASCHAIMEPIGLSLENLDAVGKERSLGESSEPIDASGSLPDGTAFVGVTGLKQALLTQPDQIATTITEKLLTYALGRGLEYYDAPAVRGIVRDARAEEFRFTSGLIMGVVQSTPFQMRMPGNQ